MSTTITPAYPEPYVVPGFLSEAQGTIDAIVRALPEDRGYFADGRDARASHLSHTVDLDASGDVFDGEGVYAVRVFDARARVRSAHRVAARAFVLHVRTDLQRVLVELRRMLPILETHVRLYGRAAEQALRSTGSTLYRVVMQVWGKYVAWCTPRVLQDSDAIENISAVPTSPEECYGHSSEYYTVARHPGSPEREEVRYADLPLWWYGGSHLNVSADVAVASRSDVYEEVPSRTDVRAMTEEASHGGIVSAVSQGVMLKNASGTCLAEPVHHERAVSLKGCAWNGESFRTQRVVRVFRVWEHACTRVLRTLTEGPARAY